MTLPELNRSFSTDEDCREILTRLRWPESVECPRCQNRNVWWIQSRKQFTCSECSYQFSVTTGTIFNDSHLPLPIWFMAVLLLIEARKGMSAMQLKRTLWGQHRGSYKTAWYLFHRIRAAMADSRTHHAGRYSRNGRNLRWRRANGALVLKQRRPRRKLLSESGNVVATCASSMPRTPRVALWQSTSRRTSHEDVDVIVTDDWRAYARSSWENSEAHETVNHWQKEYVRLRNGHPYQHCRVRLLAA